LKADNLISIEIKNVNEPVTINLLKNSPSLAKRGRGDLAEANPTSYSIIPYILKYK